MTTADERDEQADEDGQGKGSGPEEGENAGGWLKAGAYGRRIVFPLLTLVSLVAVLVLFHKILLPFVFACAIVYLMEPIVVRLSRTPERSQASSRGLPRWITVILVYLIFFTTVTVSAILIVPRLFAEVQRLGDTVPDSIQTFREESLPGLNERLQNYLKAIAPADSGEGESVRKASTAVREARQHAARTATAFASAHSRVGYASDLRPVWTSAGSGVRGRAFRPGGRAPPERVGAGSSGKPAAWSPTEPKAPPAFRIERGPKGTAVYLNPDGLEITEVGEGRWRVRRPSKAAAEGETGGLHTMVDLERKLDEMLQEAISFSNEQVTEAIEFAQELALGILDAFIAIILTLMVAAFISIDLPRFLGFFRSLVPDERHADYDDLLARFDEGLSGVVRGQLIICLINGIFTYIGLILLNIKFSLLLAVIAGVLSIIPVFGAVISTIPICIIALTQSFMTAVLALGWILLIHFVEANILNPKIIGTSAEIHPVIVIFALLAGESTGGLVGAILAVPVASLVLSLFKFIRDKVWDQQPERHSEISS